MTHSDDALLTASVRLFRGRGFAATSLRQIATEAGMLPGSVHYRSRTKEGILVALMERGLGRACDDCRHIPTCLL
jgi:AcrR family transcriptional regulator